MTTQKRINYFTPICNFDLAESLINSKIARLEIKEISKEDSLHYFGITERVFDEDGNLSGFDSYNKSFDILNEPQKLSLFKCKYAFISKLNLDEHKHEVENILNAIRLLKLSGITCPVTFNDKSPGLSFAHPLFSPIKEKAILSNNELVELEKLLTVLAKIKPADIDLLRLVTTSGRSILSLVFLVIILERNIMSGDNKSEISFKIRVFGSKSLAKYFNLDERMVFDTLKKVYELRSSFSHGGEVSSDKVDEIFSGLYDYTVKILRIAAENPKVFREYRDNLLFENNHEINK
jgi:hypothetical protein